MLPSMNTLKVDIYKLCCGNNNNCNNNNCNNNNYYYIGVRVRFGVQRRHRGLYGRLLMKFNDHMLTTKNLDEMKFEI